MHLYRHVLVCEFFSAKKKLKTHRRYEDMKRRFYLEAVELRLYLYSKRQIPWR